MKRTALMLLLAACASRPSTPTTAAASRADVTASLYQQFDLVLARQAELADATDGAATRERAELLRLAAEIAIRIVRIDPQADGNALVDRIEQAR